MSEELKKKFCLAIPYLRKAIADAKKNGAVKLAIVSKKPNGSGKVECEFECEEFMTDLATLVGCPTQTEDDDARAIAEKFLQEHGLK